MGETEEELPGFAVGALGVGRGVGFEPEAVGFGPFLGLGDLLLVSEGGADPGEAPGIRPGGRWGGIREHEDPSQLSRKKLPKGMLQII